MIKFFRNIRQRLFTESKFTKYLLYANGEIILVVIGILIALQINNWNESRKAKISENELYNQILKDLDLDNKKIQEAIRGFNRTQSMQYHVYQESKGLAKYDPNVPYRLFRQIRLFELVIKDNYSEKYVMIKNDSIRKQLELYFKMEDRYRYVSSGIGTFKNEHLRPSFSKYGIHDTQVFFDNHHLDYWDIVTKNYINYSKLKQQYGTVEFDQLLFNLGIKTSFALQMLKQVQEEGNKLRQTLENELNLSK